MASVIVWGSFLALFGGFWGILLVVLAGFAYGIGLRVLWKAVGSWPNFMCFSYVFWLAKRLFPVKK